MTVSLTTAFFDSGPWSKKDFLPLHFFFATVAVGQVNLGSPWWGHHKPLQFHHPSDEEYCKLSRWWTSMMSTKSIHLNLTIFHTIDDNFLHNVTNSLPIHKIENLENHTPCLSAMGEYKIKISVKLKEYICGTAMLVGTSMCCVHNDTCKTEKRATKRLSRLKKSRPYKSVGGYIFRLASVMTALFNFCFLMITF